MAVRVDQFMCRSDNFGALVHDDESGRTLLIDAPEETPILAAIERTGWKPDAVADHPSPWRPCRGEPRAQAEIRPDHHRAEGRGGKNPRHRPVRLRRRCDPVRPRDDLGVWIRPVTRPAISPTSFPNLDVLFAADTLFALGCGRLLECKPPVMFESLQKLAALPLETRVYCGHEYTQANARFALTVDPTNSALKERSAEIDRLRAGGKATLPTTIGLELSTNPFLRWHDPVIRKNLGMEKAADVEVFAEIRKRKDVF